MSVTANGRNRQRLVLDTVLLGIAGALAARAFVVLLRACQNLLLGGIAGYRPPGLASEGDLSQHLGSHGNWLIPLATTLGGLLTGVLVYTLAPEAEGHGTDAAIAAFHRARGVIRARVPLVKLLASAITIGSGGSAGREGPIALIAAGIGSAYARTARRTEEETRLLVLAGMAAGLSAIFRSPIGTAIFAIEVLYSEMEFEGGALFYTMLASIVSYAINGLFVGLGPLFVFPPRLQAPGVVDYFWYLLLGLASGLMATAMPPMLYSVRDGFRRLPIPAHLKPAVGGFGVGIIGLFAPEVLAGGYGWIQQAIDGRLPVMLLLALAFAKALAFDLTIGSGGSGGVFGPSLYIGAMLGGFLAQLFHQPTAAFVVVGMAAVFAGAARVPVATLLMVAEMTGDYNMFVAAGLAVMASHFVQASLSGHVRYRSLYEAQVPTRADSPAHYAEQLQTAMRLLASGVSIPAGVGAVELSALLTSGIPFMLGGGRQIRIGVLRPESCCVGQPMRSGCLGPGEEINIVVALRGGDLVPPDGNQVLRAGDRLLLITSEGAWAKAAERDLEPSARPH